MQAEKFAHLLRKKGKPVNELEQKAKLGVAKSLSDSMDGEMHGKLNKVTVASSDKEGLKTGLDKAKEMLNKGMLKPAVDGLAAEEGTEDAMHEAGESAEQEVAEHMGEQSEEELAENESSEEDESEEQGSPEQKIARLEAELEMLKKQLPKHSFNSSIG